MTLAELRLRFMSAAITGLVIRGTPPAESGKLAVEYVDSIMKEIQPKEGHESGGYIREERLRFIKGGISVRLENILIGLGIENYRDLVEYAERNKYGLSGVRGFGVYCKVELLNLLENGGLEVPVNLFGGVNQ